MKVKGIKLYRFIAPKELYLSGDVYEANKGFCVPSNSCLPTGLLNISRCQPQSKLSGSLHNIKVAPRFSAPASFPGSLFPSASTWSPGNEKDERTWFRGEVPWLVVGFVGG